jgi:outer membrane protein assembly factor BamA
MLYVGPDFQFYSYDSTDKFNKVRNVEVNPLSGLNQGVFDKRQSYFGGKLALVVDTRNHKALPEKGITWSTSFNVMSGIGNNSYKSVSQFNTAFSFYVPLAKDWLVWANRTGAGVTTGNNFEFFQAQYLGSNEDLRGFRRERWAGRSKFFNQTELRWKWANLRTYLFPASIGMFAFVDAGRVWVKNDTVNDMAVGYGAGIWFAPLKRIVLTLSYAMSDEDKLPLFGFGWKF